MIEIGSLNMNTSERGIISRPSPVGPSPRRFSVEPFRQILGDYSIENKPLVTLARHAFCPGGFFPLLAAMMLYRVAQYRFQVCLDFVVSHSPDSNARDRPVSRAIRISNLSAMFRAPVPMGAAIWRRVKPVEKKLVGEKDGVPRGIRTLV